MRGGGGPSPEKKLIIIYWFIFTQKTTIFRLNDYMKFLWHTLITRLSNVSNKKNVLVLAAVFHSVAMEYLILYNDGRSMRVGKK